MDRLLREIRAERIFNNFLEEQGFIGIDVIIDGSNWCYDEDARIVYGCVDEVDKKGCEFFMKYCKENGLEWDCPSIIMSLMHEVYHDITRDFFDKFSWGITDVYVGLVNAMKKMPNEQDMYNYFNSPRERTATINAIMFVNDNREYIEDLIEELKEAWIDE